MLFRDKARSYVFLGYRLLLPVEYRLPRARRACAGRTRVVARWKPLVTSAYLLAQSNNLKPSPQKETRMADAKTKARKHFAELARKLGKLRTALLAEERHLEAIAGYETDREAQSLAAAAGCVAVDNLRPAIEALERAARS